MIVDEDMAVTISHEGYIKRNPVTLYRAQRRGGKGKIGTTTKEEDFVEYLFIASMHSYILFFTTIGKVYWIKVHELPQASRAARGKPIVNLLNLEPGERVSAFLTGARVPGRALYRVCHQERLDQEDRADGLRQSAPVGNSRHRPRRTGRGDRRAAYRRPAGD